MLTPGQNTKMMEQLLFHGKKTVPAALRRDVWRPHFSIHFPRTPAGAEKGLRVYRELRELTLKRQLDPPKEVRIATEEDVERAKRSLGPKMQEKLDNISTHRGADRGKFVMPVPGKRLPQFLVAKRLMNQKATSVADVAATLARLSGANQRTPQQILTMDKEQRKKRELRLSGKALKRLADIRTREAAKAAELDMRQEYAVPRPGYPKIDKHSLARMSTEFDGAVDLTHGALTRADLLDLKSEATEAEIGAQQALDSALLRMQADKDAEIDAITKRIHVQVEERSAKMTEAEREQAQQAHEVAKGLKQEEVDARIRQVTEDLKQEREEMQKRYPKPDKEQQAELHMQKNLGASKLAEVKKAEERHLSWVGLYAEIGPAVDQALTKIDEEWRSKLAQLQADVEQERRKHSDVVNHEVEIRWADLRDGTYAREWPDTVIHAELQPKAVIKTAQTTVRQHYHLDEDEQAIPEQSSNTPRTRASTVHVFGSDIPEQTDATKPTVGRYWPPEQRAGHAVEARKQRIGEWVQTETPMLRDRILAIRQQAASLHVHFEDVPIDSKLETTQYCMHAITWAREALDRMVENEQQDRYHLDEMEAQLTYVGREIFHAESEVDIDSQTPDADRARIAWIKLQRELIEVESKNPAASVQADHREEYFVKCAEREALLYRAYKGERGIDRRLAHDDLQRFDESFPMFAEAEERLGKADLAAEIVDVEGEIKSLEAEQDRPTAEEASARSGPRVVKSQIRDLHLRRQELADKITELTKELRNDKPAWVEFKSRGRPERPRPTARRSAPASQNQRPVMEEPAQPVEPPRGIWNGVKKMFGRK